MCVKRSVCVLVVSLVMRLLVQAPEEPSSSAKRPPRAGTSFEGAERRIIDLTNEFRKTQGRRELKNNDELSQAARYFADFMARTDKYGHTADDKQPADRVKEFGYAYCILAENIAWQFNSSGYTPDELAQAFVTGWKNSKEHRANMLDPDVYDIGVGVARSEKTGRYYAVQEFGRPRSKSISFEIANRAGAPVRYTVDGESFTLPDRYTRSHRACRPPKLVFRLGPDADAKEGDPIRPTDRARFAVSRGESGTYTIEQR